MGISDVCSTDVLSSLVACLFPRLQAGTDSSSIKGKAVAVASYKHSSFFCMSLISHTTSPTNVQTENH